MKLFRWLALGGVIAGLQVSSLRAADVPVTPTAPASKKALKAAEKEVKKEVAEAKKKRDWYPFHGTVESVNTTASTIALKKEEGQRVLHLDGKSTLSRLGKPASLADIKPGDYARGKLHKNTRDEEVVTDGKFDQDVPVKPAKLKKAKDEKSKDEKKS